MRLYSSRSLECVAKQNYLTNLSWNETEMKEEGGRKAKKERKRKAKRKNAIHGYITLRSLVLAYPALSLIFFPFSRLSYAV